MTLVAMGAGSGIGPDSPEDDACADLLAARLEGRPIDTAEIERRVRASPAAQLALDPEVDWITQGDVELAVALDRFDFAVEARVEENRVVARRLS